MFGSSRSGGIRGGQDQFNWDDVKVDKHRENYLGKCTNSRLNPLSALTREGQLACYSEIVKMAECVLVSSTCSCFIPFVLESLITQSLDGCDELL